MTAPGTIFPFVGNEPYDVDSSYTRPGGPGGPGGPAGPFNVEDDSILIYKRKGKKFAGKKK